MRGTRSNPRTTHTNAGIPAGMFIKTKGNAEIHSYADCQAFLGGENNKQIASNVQIVRLRSTMIAVKLYDTFILVYEDEPGQPLRFQASNGGFNTPTTTTRLNQFGPLGCQFFHHRKKLCFFVPGHDYNNTLCNVDLWHRCPSQSRLPTKHQPIIEIPKLSELFAAPTA